MEGYYWVIWVLVASSLLQVLYISVGSNKAVKKNLRKQHKGNFN
jgi:hypothetical protein